MNLWSKARFQEVPDGSKPADHRTEQEKDYDRILFSSAVRRLADKTQVFPLDANDSVRKRLTHSHEVANLARSIGLRIHSAKSQIFGEQDFHRVVSPLLAAAGLAHDLGNPPFGHQGEAAIGHWFKANEWVFTQQAESSKAQLEFPIEEPLKSEFLSFDGNPQSIRLLTRLQISQGFKGLDLTASTLASCMKYVADGNSVNKSKAASAGLHKIGFFESEREIIDWVRAETGLQPDQRHPIAWITEAADDTAYSVLDLEDSMKKKIISPDDLLNILQSDDGLKGLKVIDLLVDKFGMVDQRDRAPSIRRDIKIGYLRSFLIDDLAQHATNEFIANADSIFSGSQISGLMDTSKLCQRLKSVAIDYAFNDSQVLRAEVQGRNAISFILDEIWNAIVNRSDPDDILSRRTEAKSRYVFSLISPNYLESTKRDLCNEGACKQTRYRELRLMTDMVSGMTDQFAINLQQKILSVT